MLLRFEGRKQCEIPIKSNAPRASRMIQCRFTDKSGDIKDGFPLTELLYNAAWHTLKSSTLLANTQCSKLLQKYDARKEISGNHSP